jgi:hypothetical protein
VESPWRIFFRGFFIGAIGLDVFVFWMGVMDLAKNLLVKAWVRDKGKSCFSCLDLT